MKIIHSKNYRAGAFERIRKPWHRTYSWREILRVLATNVNLLNRRDVEFPKNIQATLREYQSKGFSWLWFMYKYGLKGILADDMGLGKNASSTHTFTKTKNEMDLCLLW